MAIRLLALDMDGTLLQDDHVTITEENLNAIRKAMELGIEFVPTTGRMAGFLPPKVKEISGLRYVICSNGAVVYDIKEDKVIHTNYMSADKMKQVIRVLEPLDAFFEVYRNGESYIEKNRLERYRECNIPESKIEFFHQKTNPIDSLDTFLEEHTDCLEKIYMPYLKPEIFDYLEKELPKHGVFLTSSYEYHLEANSIDCNKGSALHFLGKHLNIAPEEMLAMGDNRNDAEMLAFVGCSVAMENAIPAVKQIAKYETCSNEENGVARAIERFILDK